MESDDRNERIGGRIRALHLKLLSAAIAASQVAALYGSGGGAPNAANTATLKNVSGSTVTDYPLRFARVFAQGEIANAPQVLIDGVSQTTGSDVKSRWGDGSVKHAILSTVVGSMTNNVAKALTFQNQAESNTALTKSEMLAFDFDAVISMTVGGVTHTASARTMLTADKYTVWCANQIATTVIIADHSSSHAYDMTWSSVPARPIFVATFWKDLNKVEVSAICEQSNAEALGDLSVTTLTITKGSASPTTAYTKSSFVMYLGTRWIKRFWIGTAPATQVNFNHNLSYLKDANAFANFDTDLVPDEGTLSDRYTEWTAAPKDIYDEGLWLPFMANTGGRLDIGPMPTQTALWLYTGDYRMRELALGQADLAGSWMLHFRESITTKRLLRSDTVNSGTGFGLPISATDRKTTVIVANTLDAGVTGDALKVIGSQAAHGDWEPDNAHTPDAFSTQYVLTGDPFYLEQMQMWAAALVHFSNGGPTDAFYGRGPTGAEGGIMSQVRSWAWQLRNRCLVAFWSPDTDPMKPYFEQMIDDLLATLEGRFGITTGTFHANTQWTWQHDLTPFPDTNPLHMVEKNSDMRPVVNASVGGGQSPWMVNFNIYAAGRAKEMGYASDAWLNWLCDWMTGMVTDAGFNPYQISDYRQATGPSPLDSGAFFSAWSSVKTWALSTDQSKTATDWLGYDASNIDNAYLYIATCAASFIAQYTGGDTAWDWVKTNGYDVIGDKETCPKWAVLPRN